MDGLCERHAILGIHEHEDNDDWCETVGNHEIHENCEIHEIHGVRKLHTRMNFVNLVNFMTFMNIRNSWTWCPKTPNMAPLLKRTIKERGQVRAVWDSGLGANLSKWLPPQSDSGYGGGAGGRLNRITIKEGCRSSGFVIWEIPSSNGIRLRRGIMCACQPEPY